MEKRDIAELVAKVLYLKDAGTIDHQKSIFLDYGMSSIDFVDFAYELKSASPAPIAVEDLWPIGRLINDRELYADGRWTERGLARLGQLFPDAALEASATQQQLRGLFSIDYIARRLDAAAAPKEAAHV